MKIQFLPGWRHFWRLWSLRLNALGLAILGYVQFDPVGALGFWNMMPEEVRSLLPSNFLTIVGMSLFLLSMVARLVHQPRLEDNGIRL